MDNQHEIIKDKVCDWFQKEKPNCNIEKEGKSTRLEKP